MPIEAVAAVIECKSKCVTWQETYDEEGNLIEGGMAAWCSSIERLRTSRDSITRMAAGTVIFGTTYNGNQVYETSTQTSTRPIRIFCGYQTYMSPEIKTKMEEFFTGMVYDVGSL